MKKISTATAGKANYPDPSPRLTFRCGLFLGCPRLDRNHVGIPLELSHNTRGLGNLIQRTFSVARLHHSRSE